MFVVFVTETKNQDTGALTKIAMMSLQQNLHHYNKNTIIENLFHSNTCILGLLGYDLHMHVLKNFSVNMMVIHTQHCYKDH